jgi:integrase
MNLRTEEGLAAGTIEIVYKAVRLFMSANGRNFEIMAKDRPKVRYQGQRIISRSQIVELLKNVSSRNRRRNIALVLLAKDSGLRVSDITALNVEGILDARKHIVNEEPFLELNPLKTLKMGEIAYTVLGPESVRAVSRYIGDRESGPLFLNEAGERVSRTSISQALHRLSKFLEDSRKISAHSLRKYFVTSLQAGGMSDEWIKLLIGKATDVYSQPHLDGSLLRAYIEKYDSLRVYGKPDTNKRIHTLEKDIQEVKDILVITQGMIMDNLGLKNRDELIQAFNKYVKDTINNKSTEE